jgi:acetyl esterase/lipase
MTTTTSPRAALTPVIEPHTQRWLDELAASAGSPPLWELSPEDARQLLRYVQASVPVRLQPADIDNRIIPGGLTGQVSIRIIRPAGAAGVPLVIFHFHGGGWILGDKDTNERLDRELANAARAVVVFVDYTPAPDAQYPVQNDQACTAMQWAIANAGGIGADPARVALVGDSAGGNVTAALTFMAKERGGRRSPRRCCPTQSPTPTWIPAPTSVTPTDLGLPARRCAGSGTPTCPTGRGAPRSPPHRCKPRLTSCAGCPPALIINGEHDVLRDEGEAYARKLSQAGVPVTEVRYGGTIHDFVLLNPIASTPAPRAAIAQAASYLRSVLTS